MKGRSYLELEEMFQKRLPARQFKHYQCDLDHAAEGKTVYLEALN